MCEWGIPRPEFNKAGGILSIASYYTQIICLAQKVDGITDSIYRGKNQRHKVSSTVAQFIPWDAAWS